MKDTIRQEYKDVYKASSKKIAYVEVPEFNFIMIDGIGNSGDPEFKGKSHALRIMSQEIREYFRREKKMAYMISPLECLWDTYDNTPFYGSWKKIIKFTLMIAQPRLLDEITFNKIREELMLKRHVPYIMDIYLKTFNEGPCVQLLHKGALVDDLDTAKRLMEYITIQGMKLKGMHHTIYLNDPDKVSSSKQKTIVRYAVEGQD